MDLIAPCVEFATPDDLTGPSPKNTFWHEVQEVCYPSRGVMQLEIFFSTSTWMVEFAKTMEIPRECDDERLKRVA